MAMVWGTIPANASASATVASRSFLKTSETAKNTADAAYNVTATHIQTISVSTLMMGLLRSFHPPSQAPGTLVLSRPAVRATP